MRTPDCATASPLPAALALSIVESPTPRAVSLPAPASVINQPRQWSATSHRYLNYAQAQALLHSPMEDGRSVRQALSGLLRGDRPHDDVVRVLALAHLPWREVHAALFGADCTLAGQTLVLMLHALFAIDDDQGARLTPLLRRYGHSRSLDQWATALAEPRHEHQGRLKLTSLEDADDVAAVEAQLAAMTPVAEMSEGEAGIRLLTTLLPAWSGKQRRDLRALWREDSAGWSIIDAAVRARDVEATLNADKPRKGANVPVDKVLHALQQERKAQPFPAPALGNVAEAVLGLLNPVLAAGPLAVADTVMNFGAQLSGGTSLHRHGEAGPVMQPRKALHPLAMATTPRGLMQQRLLDVGNALQLRAMSNDFYRDWMQEWRAQQLSRPRVVSATAPTARRGPAASQRVRNSTDSRTGHNQAVHFPLPDHLDSPGRLTALGARPSLADLSLHRPSGVDAAYLQPASRTSTPLGTTESAMTLPIANVTVAPSADEVMIEQEIGRIQAQEPAWLNKASQDERNYLQTLIDLQTAWEDVWVGLIGQVDSLQAYTEGALADALNASVIGRGIDPATVNVTVTERHWPDPDVPGAFLDMPAPWPVPPGGAEPVLSERTVSLVEFALGNIAQRWMLGPDHAVSMDRTVNGTAHALSENEIAEVIEIVRRADIGSTYPEYLRDALLWPLAPLAGPLRQAWVQSNGLLLEAELQAARLEGSTFPRNYYDYLDPIRGHDLVSRMVEHVLQYPDEATRPKLASYRPYVHAFKIGYADSTLGTLLGDAGACRVNGVWVLQMDAPARGVTPVVVITPGAPDGKIFRVYEDMHEAKSDPYWRTEAGYAWLKDRMSHEDQQRVDGLAFGVDPVKSRMPLHPKRFTADKIQLERIQGDFLHEAYEYMARTMIRDGASASTTTAEVDWWAALSFGFDQAMLLDDVTSPLPLGKLLGKLKLLLKPGRWFDAGTPTLKAGRSLVVGRDIAGKKLPFSRLVKLEDGRVGVLASPPGPPRLPPLPSAPNWAQLNDLQERAAALTRPPARQLSLPDERELHKMEVRELGRLKQELSALKGAYTGQYECQINQNREAWWQSMDGVPELSSLNDAERSHYVAYLLSQRSEASQVTAMLRSLKTVGLKRASLPYRALHGRAMQLVKGDQPGTSASVPVVGPEPGPAPKPDLKSPQKRVSEGVPGGSPSKQRLSQPLQNAGGSLPPASDFQFVEVSRAQWPPYLYHYTTAKNYNEIMSDGGINPSNVDPKGRSGNGPAPRIVYLTPLEPSLGRSSLAPLLFGKSQHGDRTDKVARVIKIDTRYLPDTTRMARFTGSHQHVYAVGTPGSGWMSLRGTKEEPSILVKPTSGNEVVPW
ncbi:hypothetical protein NSY55_26490 [Pseudomonas aeruginosa]|nr:hypothetical protein [Pseudomonas aeruginosa]